VPGEGDFQLAKGEHVGYLETTSNVGGTIYHAPAVSVSCTVTAPDGAAVPLESPSATSSYKMGGFDGRSIFMLTAPAAGTYHLACTGSNGPAAIAIGEGIMGGIFMMIGVTFALGIAAVIIVVVVRRKRKRRV